MTLDRPDIRLTLGWPRMTLEWQENNFSMTPTWLIDLNNSINYLSPKSIPNSVSVGIICSWQGGSYWDTFWPKTIPNYVSVWNIFSWKGCSYWDICFVQMDANKCFSRERPFIKGRFLLRYILAKSMPKHVSVGNARSSKGGSYWDTCWLGRSRPLMKERFLPRQFLAPMCLSRNHSFIRRRFLLRHCSTSILPKCLSRDRPFMSWRFLLRHLYALSCANTCLNRNNPFMKRRFLLRHTFWQNRCCKIVSQ